MGYFFQLPFRNYLSVSRSVEIFNYFIHSSRDGGRRKSELSASGDGSISPASEEEKGEGVRYEPDARRSRYEPQRTKGRGYS